jgi:hypothetical protein
LRRWRGQRGTEIEAGQAAECRCGSIPTSSRISSAGQLAVTLNATLRKALRLKALAK